MLQKTAALILMVALCAGRLPAADDLAKGFVAPPDSTRPGVWWRWIDGNVTKEGISRDLREMSRQGIRRVDIFDVAGAPQVGKVGMMGPEWREMFRYAIQEAAQANIRVGVVPAAGWGMGGPWIDPAHAAKMLKHVEIQADGPQHFSARLPVIPGGEPYYRDIAVVAFREKPTRPAQPASVIASSSKQGYCGEENWPPADVADGDVETCWKAGTPVSANSPAWLEFRYHAPLTASALFIAGEKNGGPENCELQSSSDGKQFQTLASFSLAKGEARRVAFAKTTASIFRLVIKTAHVPDVQLAEAWLLRDNDEPPLRPGIQWWWFKSGQRSFWDWPKKGPAAMDEEYPEDGIFDCCAADVVDLTSGMAPDGKLNWEVPAGRWTIARFGAVLGGEGPRMMSRALPGGYEPDPFSPVSADVMVENTVKPMLQDAGSQAGKTFKDVLVDSWEYGAAAAGFQPTWADHFREEFQKRRGYDLVKWLPAMAGRIVDSRQRTDRFFWDYRQTLGDLYLDLYARLTQLAHARGLSTRAENGYGTYPFQHIEGLAAFARVDTPMGEFWYNDPVMTQHYHFADAVRTAASAAHIYGRKYAAAESLTIAHGIWQAPGEFKTYLDQAFCSGLNQSMLHLYSLQYDVTARPGLDTYDLLNANMTWWEKSHAFLDYIARCQSLLQRGLAVADACYFYGEGTCKFVPNRAFLDPALPAGYEFDGINAEVILQRLAVKKSLLVLPDGMSYRYLVLPPKAGWTVSAGVLEKIRALVEAGATVVGPKPSRAPGLTDFSKQDAQVTQVSAALWGSNPAVSGIRKIGKGRVIWGMPLQELVAKDNLSPDVEFKNESAGFQWCHRREGKTEIYFLSNQRDQTIRSEAVFRVSGKQPELWNPDSGQMRDLTEFRFEGARTALPLEFAPGQSWFVVFRKSAAKSKSKLPNFPLLASAGEVSGPWQAQFDPKWGGPEEPVVFESLGDWSKRAEEGIKYYSGTAVYRKSFDLPDALRQPGTRVFLDLGKVKNLAEVRLNGRGLGVIWTAPWQVEITDAVKLTGNNLEIDVVNLWPNRLIGDASLPKEKRFTRTNVGQFSKGHPLMESGLLGPVTILCAGKN